MRSADAETSVTVDSERQEWLDHVAEAARQAADALRPVDDPYSRDLLDDLVELHETVSAQLRAARLDG